MPSDQPRDPATEPSPGGSIRHARPEEAATLSDLALRSKAHWGYDAAFLEACREDLTITADDIAHAPVFVLEEDGRVIGFYALRWAGDEALLTDLFVDPEHIGRGHGHRLWEHAVKIARRSGFATLTLHSDPYAEGFYRAMGAVRVGVVPSTVFPERLLPLMRFSLYDGRTSQEAVQVE